MFTALGGRLLYGLTMGMILVFGCALRLWDPAPVARLRLLAFDTFQKISPQKADPAYPVRIIDIDEASIAALGQWPWRRDMLAELVDKLGAHGARVIAFDMVFPSAGRSTLRELPEKIRKRPEIAALLAEFDAESNADQRFADAIKRQPVALGIIGRTGPVVGVAKPKAGFALLGTGHQAYVPGFAAVTNNLAELEAAAAGIGALNWFPEHDQVVRKVPMLIHVGDTLLPSLTAETLRLYSRASTIAVRSSSAGGEASFGGETGITSVKIGPVQVPTDKSGQVWLAFTPHDRERFRSAAQVMAGKVPREDIAGRIILIGSSAPGLLDLRATPLDATIAGVEVHAQALEQLLKGRSLHRPDYSVGVEIAGFVIIGSMMAVLVYLSGAFAGTLLGAAAIVVVVGLAWWAYFWHGILIDPVYPTVALTAVFIVATAFGYVRSEQEKNRVRQAFGQYLAPNLVERLTKEPWRLQLGGETRELTIMFSDVRGFTSIAEDYRDNPQGLTRLMNRLLSPLTQTIMQREGTVDKYIGDAIMAFWNAPLDDPHHARHACEAALMMIAQLVQLNVDRKRTAGLDNVEFKPLHLRIGVATGQAMVGNMGSDMRFDYSVMGDTVNLASRLEGLSGVYGVPILAADATCLNGASHLAALEIDRVRVLGRTNPERIWAIVGDSEVARSERFRRFSSGFHEATRLYRTQDWDQAVEKFGQLTQDGAELGLSDLITCFVERIDDFRADPPAFDWDGIWVMQRK